MSPPAADAAKGHALPSAAAHAQQSRGLRGSPLLAAPHALGWLTRGLLAHASDADACVAGLRLLARVSARPGGADATAAAGGVAACLAPLSAHLDSEAVVSAGLDALAALALSPAGEAAAVSAACLELSVAALSRHGATSTAVAAAGCSAVRNLSGSAAGQSRCLRAQVLPCLLKLLRLYGTSGGGGGAASAGSSAAPDAADADESRLVSVLTPCLGALRNACASERNNVPAGDLGAAAAAAAALGAHPLAHGVQAAGLGALWSLSRFHGNKARVVAAGGLRLAAAAAAPGGPHWSHGDVLIAAFGLISSLAWSSAVFKEKARQAGCEEAAAAAAVSHEGAGEEGEGAAVREAAAEALRRVAKRGDGPTAQRRLSDVRAGVDAFMPNL